MLFKTKSNYDWLIAGLGNPGLQYENTRHNAGILAEDKLAEECNFENAKNRFEALNGEFKLNGTRILVIKPQTFMNNSGKAVSKISSFYKIPAERFIIVHDDISLDTGKIRIRRKGSDGGQKGLRDIIELMGTENIIRIKIGVGAKPNPDYDLASWVLSKFSREEQTNLNSALERAAEAVKEIILHGVDSAMNKYNN